MTRFDTCDRGGVFMLRIDLHEYILKARQDSQGTLTGPYPLAWKRKTEPVGVCSVRRPKGRGTLATRSDAATKLDLRSE